jgi:hypothetical protein
MGSSSKWGNEARGGSITGAVSASEGGAGLAQPGAANAGCRKPSRRLHRTAREKRVRPRESRALRTKDRRRAAARARGFAPRRFERLRNAAPSACCHDRVRARLLGCGGGAACAAAYRVPVGRTGRVVRDCCFGRQCVLLLRHVENAEVGHHHLHGADRVDARSKPGPRNQHGIVFGFMHFDKMR